MCSSRGDDRGFTLVETLVAVLIGVTLVVAIGVLGNALIRHRANADSNSAAMSLAQMKLEQLKTLKAAELTAGSFVDGSMYEDGQNAVGAPYRLSWTVSDNVPCNGSKKVVVTVTHNTNPFARAELVSYVLPRDFQPGGSC